MGYGEGAAGRQSEDQVSALLVLLSIRSSPHTIAHITSHYITSLWPRIEQFRQKAQKNKIEMRRVSGGRSQHRPDEVVTSIVGHRRVSVVNGVVVGSELIEEGAPEMPSHLTLKSSVLLECGYFDHVIASLMVCVFVFFVLCRTLEDRDSSHSLKKNLEVGTLFNPLCSTLYPLHYS